MFGQNMTQDDISRMQNAEVVDQNGDKVGSVGQIYLDDQTQRPTWVTVKTGLFGNKETFIPLDQATQDGDNIRVPYTKDFIKDAPNMDADHHISESEEDELYRYYNLEQGRGYVDTDATRRDDVVREGEVRDRADDGSVVRHEEELRVGTERVETGRVRLRKHVVTETETVAVPVERQEVHVTREPIRDGEVGGRIGDDQEVSVTLTEDRPVVEKETVAKERVGLETETHRETQQVSAEVRKEQVEVEREGDVRRDDTRR